MSKMDYISSRGFSVSTIDVMVHRSQHSPWAEEIRKKRESLEKEDAETFQIESGLGNIGHPGGTQASFALQVGNISAGLESR